MIVAKQNCASFHLGERFKVTPSQAHYHLDYQHCILFLRLDYHLIRLVDLHSLASFSTTLFLSNLPRALPISHRRDNTNLL
jgi:hypothetical protein